MISKLFTNSVEGAFVARPNRFIVYVDTPEGIVVAHCPNPGRLQEILTPGRPVILEESPDPGRTTRFTLVAARYRANVVPLVSGRANSAVGDLVLPLLCPRAEKIVAEPSSPGGRFDFLVREGGSNTYVEVKACSLVEEGVAMFPDAPTTRGRRHIEELSETSRTEARPRIVFLIMNPEARVFVPNLHTDPDFARTLLAYSEEIAIHARSIRTSRDGDAVLTPAAIPVILDPVREAVKDRGSYLLIVRLDSDQDIAVGALGIRRFRRGYYVYAGSGMAGLSLRIARHKRRKKALRWHIDYLTKKASAIEGIPVYSGRDLECPLAHAVAEIADETVAGFGSSDCACPAHLFYFRTPPWDRHGFRRVVFRFRHREALAEYLQGIQFSPGA